MLHFIRAAAVAVPRLFRAGAGFRLEARGAQDHVSAELAPGQSKADYYAWLARAPENRARCSPFATISPPRGSTSVVPVWQLIRTSSSWRQCAPERFEVAPRDKWDHITGTLRFVRDEVVPAVGEVEALSAYRNEALNRCSAGAPQSAHRLFFALDLTPVVAAASPEPR